MLGKNIFSKSKIYDNFRVLHPDGDVMFYCNEKKFNWYLRRGLAKRINDKTIKLSFMPKGKGESDEFDSGERKNICVVSGSTTNLSKHHVVPYHMRRYLPMEYKSKNSFDVVAITRELHDVYEIEATKFKEKLFDRYIKPDEVEYNKRITKLKKMKHFIDNGEDRTNFRVKIDTIIKLRKMLDEDGYFMCDLDGKCILNLDALVVERMGYDNVVKAWKFHFVETMKPKYLPPWWKPNYVKITNLR